MLFLSIFREIVQVLVLIFLLTSLLFLVKVVSNWFWTFWSSRGPGKGAALALQLDETLIILTSASSGPKEQSVLKITVYSSGHLRNYSSGLKTHLASFNMAIAADLSFYVNFVAPRERTHKQKDLLVLPGSAGASVNMCSSIWTAFPLLKQSSSFSVN